jgi:hypothetical protein
MALKPPHRTKKSRVFPTENFGFTPTPPQTICYIREVPKNALDINVRKREPLTQERFTQDKK